MDSRTLRTRTWNTKLQVSTHINERVIDSEKLFHSFDGHVGGRSNAVGLWRGAPVGLTRGNGFPREDSDPTSEIISGR